MHEQIIHSLASYRQRIYLHNTVISSRQPQTEHAQAPTHHTSSSIK